MSKDREVVVQVLNELLDAINREENIVQNENGKDYKHLSYTDGRRQSIKRMYCKLRTMLEKYNIQESPNFKVVGSSQNDKYVVDVNKSKKAMIKFCNKHNKLLCNLAKK